MVRLHRWHFGLRLALDSVLRRGLFCGGLGCVLVLGEEWCDRKQTAAESGAEQTIQKDDPPGASAFSVRTCYDG
jgi:hypothetical protein